jgi:uncharacterized protein YraI
MIRHLSLALAALTVSASIAQASPAWTSSGVNFREGPSTGYPVIAYLPRCAAVDVNGYEGGWARVNWQGNWGWVAQSYLRGSNAHCGHYSQRHGSGYARPRY